MRASRALTAVILSLACWGVPTAWAATPTPVPTTQYYVRPGGSDLNNGLSPAQAFGSVTRAVQALSVPAAYGTCLVWIAPGDYSTNTLDLTRLNTTLSARFQGDVTGAVFGVPAGPARLIALSTQASLIVAQNTSGLAFTDLELTAQASGNSIFRRLVRLESSTSASFTRCALYVSAPLWTGLYVAAPGDGTVVDSCVVSQTGVGLFLQGCSNVKVQNTWVLNNDTGVHLQDALQCALVNNLVQKNGYGVQLENACPGTALFNNLICDNGTGGVGAQFKIDHSPLADPDPFGSTPTSWRSSHNNICGSGARFAELSDPNGTRKDLPNLKAWIEATGQDLWGESLSAPPNFTAPGTPAPGDAATFAGFGAAAFWNLLAPTQDHFQLPRPQNKYDLGIVETDESGVDYFHHVGLFPAQRQGRPRQAITVGVHPSNANGVPTGSYAGPSTYLYLQAGPLPTQVDPLGVVEPGTACPPIGPTAVRGVYRITGTLPSSFSVRVWRDAYGNSGVRYPFRVVEWQDWSSSAQDVYGGRADDGSTTLFWTASPDPALCPVTATSPILASGRHFSQVRVRVRDAADQAIPGLKFGDFSFTVSGGPFDLPHGSFIEDPAEPGDYFVELASSVGGIRELAVTVLGVALPMQPQVVFQPGVFGSVTNGVGNPLDGIRLTLTAMDAAETLAALTVQGEYALLVPAPRTGPYALTVEDPAGHYARQVLSVTVPADRAVRQDVVLSASGSGSLAFHAFPNPVRRGAQVTLVYDLPEAGPFQIDLYDLRGRRLGTLTKGLQPAGRGQSVWTLQNRFGREIVPGTYLLQYRLGDRRGTFKLVIAP